MIQQENQARSMSLPNVQQETEATDDYQSEHGDLIMQKEHEIKSSITFLTEKVNFMGIENITSHLADMLGYHFMLDLLSINEEITYPTLLLIN